MEQLQKDMRDARIARSIAGLLGGLAACTKQEPGVVLEEFMGELGQQVKAKIAAKSPDGPKV